MSLENTPNVLKPGNKVNNETIKELADEHELA
jgi:hypothetical protein